MIEIDGTFGEGGGQILRTSLSLAAITGQAVHFVNIRAKRRKPGLMRQHLACVKATTEITSGNVSGAELNSRELTFEPGTIHGGDYRFVVGTAGSVTLIAQTVIPVLLRADAPSRVEIEGGTHVDQAPIFEFFDRVYLPALRKMGAEVTAKLERFGFFPAGGGKIVLEIQPIRTWNRFECLQAGNLKRSLLTAVGNGVDGQIMEDELQENLKFMRIIGTFAQLRGVRVYFVPGNGETFPLDFDVSDGVNKEKLVPEADRVLSRLRSSGVFGENHVILVDFPLVLNHRIALLPLNVIEKEETMDIGGEDYASVTHVVTHYPPTAENMLAFFKVAFDYNPNETERIRSAATSRHLMEFKNKLHIYCGHIHPGSDKQRSMALPVSANFQVHGNTLTWVKPGHLEVFEI